MACTECMLPFSVGIFNVVSFVPGAILSSGSRHWNTLLRHNKDATTASQMEFILAVQLCRSSYTADFSVTASCQVVSPLASALTRILPRNALLPESKDNGSSGQKKVD